VTGIAATGIVTLEGVSAGYRRRQVMTGLDVRIEAGERVAIIGPNGAGKSTLLRLIAGTLRARTGRVLLGGDLVDRLDRVAIARRVAAVPSQASLPFAMTVEEVVALGRLPHEHALRGAGPADQAAVVAAIERVGLVHLVGRDARELSLGERQLVLLALAVAQGAPVLLLDEPTVHLDLRHRVEAMEMLVDLNVRDGTTVVAVLHDLGLAAHFFPRLLVVYGGRLVADGPPASVLTDERIRSVFGVDPVHALRA
jgi:ABC-type cobalamin/Fe3+-siderophores transport system ATPase subunit